MTPLEQKNLGAFYTPPKVAEFLAKWGIRSRKDRVLDPGSGEGIFMKSASSHVSKSQIFGIEYDRPSYEWLTKEFKNFNVIHSSFFDVSPSAKPNFKTTLPFMDAVIGNPPYIEREKLQGVESIRKRITELNNLDFPLHTVTDVYGYFMIHATNFLKEGGRLAFIISDSWMNMDYGMALKAFLMKHYRIIAIVGFEERVFSNALVRSVLVLAEKSETKTRNFVRFVKLKNVDEIEKLEDILSEVNLDSDKAMAVEQSKMNPKEPWSVYLKASKQYFDIITNPIIVPMREIADIGIGIQSLKNDFYILNEQRAKELGLEKRFIEEVIMSPKDSPLIIKNKKEVHNFVIYCDKEHEKLKYTKILEYIKSAEKATVRQRGKHTEIIGYQNVPRINQARRNPWYNMIPEIEKRCRGTIILPRRSYTRFFAAWNKAKVVVNDNFINVEPRDSTHIIPLLAILNSSFTEYLCRVRAQTYGGGVYDLRPDDVKNLPTLNLRLISNAYKKKLSMAYDRFIESRGIDRSEIDKVIMQDILQLRRKNFEELTKEQNSLRLLATVSNGREK